MFSALGQLFETVKPNPQEIADAVVKLINLPKGQRPLSVPRKHSNGF